MQLLFKMSYNKYLREGFDDICDYKTYKYYRRLRMRNKVKSIIKRLWKGK